jgi:hypothetical protein
MFLSIAFLSEGGSDATDGSAWVGVLTALMVFAVARLFATDSPFICDGSLAVTLGGHPPSDYSGEAVIPKRPSQEDPSVPPRSQVLFVMDL